MTWAVCLVLAAAGCLAVPPARGVTGARLLLRSGSAVPGPIRVGSGRTASGHGGRRLGGADPGRWRRPLARWSALAARRRGAAAGSVETVRFLTALVAALDAGLPTRRAVALVCARSTGPLSDAVAEAAEGDRPVGEALAARVDQDRIAGLRVVAAAWGLHDRHGVVLAEGLRTATRLVADEADHRRRMATASAGPRATVRLIAALPLAGPLAGWCVGLGPFGMYAHPLAVLSLGIGLAAMAMGRWWSRRIVAGTSAPVPAAALSSPTRP